MPPSVSVSWRTSLGGALSAVGLALQGQAEPWHTVGMVVAIVGVALIGLSARDSGVTSEAAKAKPPADQPPSAS